MGCHRPTRARIFPNNEISKVPDVKAGSPRNAEEGAAPCSGYAAYQRKKPALKAKLGRVRLKQRNP